MLYNRKEIKKIRAYWFTDLSGEKKLKRDIIFLSTAGILDFIIISLYQTGIIKKLPDIDHQIFDSNAVNRSQKAYSLGGPDGPISLFLYALNILLASYVGNRIIKPTINILLTISVFANFLGAVDYLHNMLAKQKKICLYCVTGAVINFASMGFIFSFWKQN